MTNQEQIKELKKLFRHTRDPYNVSLFAMGYNDGVEACIEVVRKRQMQAVKEFAERLKEKAYVNNYCQEVILKDTVDEILKEYEVEE